MSRAQDKTFALGRLGGGVTFYPYQLSLGLTLRYWPDLYAPTIRLHLACFKLWLYFILRRKKEADRSNGESK